MGNKVFINLAVKNLQRTKDFFSALGFGFEPRFTNEDAACMILGQESFVMLLVERFYKTFTSKQIADSARTSETIIAVIVESRAKVDQMVKKALSAGGAPFREPEDQGFMYGWSFQDPDGHLWEIAHMDEKAAAHRT
jgi:uncharacterized protein